MENTSSECNIREWKEKNPLKLLSFNINPIPKLKYDIDFLSSCLSQRQSIDILVHITGKCSSVFRMFIYENFLFSRFLGKYFHFPFLRYSTINDNNEVRRYWKKRGNTLAFPGARKQKVKYRKNKQKLNWLKCSSENLWQKSFCISIETRNKKLWVWDQMRKTVQFSIRTTRAHWIQNSNFPFFYLCCPDINFHLNIHGNTKILSCFVWGCAKL